MAKSYNIEASVHKPINGGFRVKAELKEIGLYINGMVVYPPNDKHEDWQVLSPAVKYGFKYAKIIEFDGKLPLWKELRESCIEAVKLYTSENDTQYTTKGRDVVLDDIEDGPVDLSGIPF